METRLMTDKLINIIKTGKYIYTATPAFQKALPVIIAFLLILAFTALAPNSAYAWPAESDWSSLVNGASPLGDIEGEVAGSREIVGDTTYPAAYVFTK